MGWFKNNKSKFKPKENWWEDEGLWDNRSGWDGGYYGAYRPYTYYKPKFDISVDLETRVKQLIQAITGRDLKLVRAQGWGSTEDYFFYNPEDLKDISDDEVLGQILHQLGAELYQDKKYLKQLNEAYPDYKHLLNTLETNRADSRLQDRYPGVRYYADEVWENRKFIDNPLNFYEPQIDPTNLQQIKRLLKDLHDHMLAPYAFEHDKDYHATIMNIVNDENERRERDTNINPAWEFCFNIDAVQNGESELDFSDLPAKANFELALPYIKQYFEATTFEEALKIYPDIKKYYPKPTKDQQQQMDRFMSGMAGLSESEMRRALADEKWEQALNRANKDNSEDEGAFLRDFAIDNRAGKFDPARNMAIYQASLTKNKGASNTLFRLIRSILKDNTTKRYQRPFKRGKLDGKRVYKLVATDNIRIFKKPRVISEKEYLMILIVDMSGSMRGGNSTYAMDGAIVLSDVLEQLKFPYEILAYNGTVYGVKMFNKPLRRELLPSLENANGDNNELEVIKVIRQHVDKFDADKRFKKTIFWITDGQAYSLHEVKKQVRKMEAEHNATVYGIGIGNVDVKFLKETYTHYLQVPNVSQLPKALIDLMRQQFRRH